MVNTIAAKQMFDKYDGSVCQMIREGVYEKYKTYQIPKEVELQWLIEKKENLMLELQKTKNNKAVANLFAEYGHKAVQLNDDNAIDYMVNYIQNHKEEWDDNTLVRNINVVLNSLCIVKQECKKKGTIRCCLTLLNEVGNSVLKISDEYKENGVLPDYLSADKLHENIQLAISYWESELEKM